MEQILLELIELVKTAAPELWRISLRQVWAINIQSLVSLVVAVIASLLATRAVRKWGSELRKDYEAYAGAYKVETSWRSGPSSFADWSLERIDPLAAAVAVVGLLVLVVILVSTVVSTLAALPRLINPEYYAIQYLMQLAK